MLIRDEETKEKLREKVNGDTQIKGPEGEINLNHSSMVGFDSSKTMKLMRNIQGKEIIILVDSGATYNFLSNKLVQELGLPVQAAKYFVVLGDDRKTQGVGHCRGVKLTMNDIPMQLDFLPFWLGGIDVILGVDWLKNLREVKVN